MEDIKKVCIENGITEEFQNAKDMDLENRIFKSESSVIKLYYGKKVDYYYNELEVYNGLSGKSYIPKIYLNGEIDDFKYIVMEKLNGMSLFDSWKKMNEIEREDAVKQISKILRDINNIKTEKKNFRDKFENDFKNSYNLLKESSYKKELINIYNDLINNLSNDELCYLIHVDIHFYNFIYRDGKVFAYDFENTTLAPLDYQLIRWYRMWLYPDEYYYPTNALTMEDIKSYNKIMSQLLSEYSEISNIKNLDKRVKLYELLYLIKEINRCDLADEKVKKYIKTARNVVIYE